jgi:hypothetical protein
METLHPLTMARSPKLRRRASRVPGQDWGRVSSGTGCGFRVAWGGVVKVGEGREEA